MVPALAAIGLGAIAGALAAHAALFRDGGNANALQWIVRDGFPAETEGGIAGALLGFALWALRRPRERCSRAAIIAVLANVAVWACFLAVGPVTETTRFERVASDRARCDADAGCLDALLTLAADPAIHAATFWIVPFRYYQGSATRQESFWVAAVAVVLSSTFWFALASAMVGLVPWWRTGSVAGFRRQHASATSMVMSVVAGAFLGAAVTEYLGYWTMEGIRDWRSWDIWRELPFITTFGAMSGAPVGFSIWALQRPRERVRRVAIACVTINAAVWMWFLISSPVIPLSEFLELEAIRHNTTDLPVAVAGRWHGVFGVVNTADLFLGLTSHGNILLVDLLVSVRTPHTSLAPSYVTGVTAFVLSSAWWLTVGSVISAGWRWWKRRRDRKQDTAIEPR